MRKQPKPVPDFKLSEIGLADLLVEEGYRDRVYLDVKGLPTIGVGHLLTAEEKETGYIQLSDGSQVSTITQWSKAQVTQLLDDDLVRFYAAVNTVKEHLNQGQFDALVSLAFNIGCFGFTTSTALKKIKLGLHADVPNAMLMWKYPSEIIPRRKREAALYRRSTNENQT
jgi:lysozyme